MLDVINFLKAAAISAADVMKLADLGTFVDVLQVDCCALLRWVAVMCGWGG